MKIKYNHEIISGIVFALISSFLWFSIPTQVKTMEKTAITAQTLPKIAIGGMFVFAVCLLLEGIFMKEKEELTVTKESFHSAAFKKELRSILYCLFLVASDPWSGDGVRGHCRLLQHLLLRRRPAGGH